jgi:GrpB-like predicted nucleotidyltransferase (UPF0157 family)
MSTPENRDASRLGHLDAIAHGYFGLFGELHKPISITILDEPITVRAADPMWPTWFQREAALLRNTLPGDLAPEIEHIGSTSVPGLDAKPVVDLMVGLNEPKRIAEVVGRLEQLGYESLGEAGVPGRWFLRKRNNPQHYNIAVVAYDGERWRLNLAFRDFLRTDAKAARNYALAKWCAVRDGADTLLAYSEAKQTIVEAIAARARIA